MNKIIAVTIFLSLLVACRQVDEFTGNRPIVDTRGVNPKAYEADLDDCYVLADDVQASRKVATATTTGAVGGGVIGAAAGNSNTARRGAGIGAVTGVLRGAASVIHERQQVLRNCLAGRGYIVLN